MWIITLNAGSSSLKFSLFQINGKKLLLRERGVIEAIGKKRSLFKLNKEKKQSLRVRNHGEAISIIFNYILSPQLDLIKDQSKILGIGHRLVHGGERFKAPLVVNSKILIELKKLSTLAPLHNPVQIEGIETSFKTFPHIPQIVVFDTSFFQTIPEYAYIYALPWRFYKKYGIRKYGFHGISHEYVAQEASLRLRKPLHKINLITCHLGNGASITAIKNGKAIDTSMGFTPLEGLVMGTRCGDIDPAIIFFLLEKGFSFKKIEEILNKESGILGISGISNDMRDIRNAIKKKEKRAILAYEIFLYRLLKYISAYIGILGNCDAVVLTGGIGENQPQLKRDIEKRLSNLLKKNNTKVLVIATDEELMIARYVLRMVK